jgi:hypothetical protein
VFWLYSGVTFCTALSTPPPPVAMHDLQFNPRPSIEGGEGGGAKSQYRGGGVFKAAQDIILRAAVNRPPPLEAMHDMHIT